MRDLDCCSVSNLRIRPSILNEIDSTRMNVHWISCRWQRLGNKTEPSKPPSRRLEHDCCFVDDIIACNLVPELYPLSFQVCQIQKLNGMGFLTGETVLDLEITQP